MARHNEPYLILGLASGKQLRVDKIMLYPEIELLQVMMIKAKAHELMGSPNKRAAIPGKREWTLGGTDLLDFYQAAISNGKMKRGLNLINKAGIQLELLKSRGEFISASMIDGIETPDPRDWKATLQSESRFDFNNMSAKEKSKFIEKYGLSRKRITKGKATVTGPTSYVYDGDDFIGVVSEGKAASIRWNAVDYYEFT